MSGTDKTNGVATRLDIIIRMLLDFKQDRDAQLSTGDHLVFLEKLGLAPSEAARILGINPNQLTSYRRRAKGRPKGVQKAN